MSFMPETSTAERRVSEVESQFARVDETTEYIDKIVSELEAALVRSILAQRTDTQGAEAQNSPEPVRVPLAQSLHDHNSRLERIRERLSSILSRIEA